MSNQNIRVDAIGLAAEVVELRNEIARLKNQTNWVCKCGGTDCEGQKENADLRDTLDAVIWADERGVELWRAAHPGNELVVPDRAKLVGWLLEQNAALRQALEDMPTCRCGLSTDEQCALSVENAALRTAAVEVCALARVWATVWGDKLSTESIQRLGELEQQILKEAQP